MTSVRPNASEARHGWLTALAGATALATAVTTAGCDTARQALTLPDDAESAATKGGYSATGAELSATDALGRPRYQVKAAAITQNPGEEAVELTDVVVEFPDSRGQTWVMTAKSGRMSSTARETPAIVDLEGDVRLRSSANGRTGPLALETSALRFDTAANRATTDQPVKLKSGARTLEARGMTADLGTRRLTLESEVHGRFTP